MDSRPTPGQPFEIVGVGCEDGPSAGVDRLGDHQGVNRMGRVCFTQQSASQLSNGFGRRPDPSKGIQSEMNRRVSCCSAESFRDDDHWDLDIDL